MADRVATLAADMRRLPVPPSSIDLLWAEGSAYVMGFDAALATWRPTLAPGGTVVLTEAEWLTPEPAREASDFWHEAYPAMRTTARNVAAAQAAGWIVRALYVLPQSDWDTYYEPLGRRLANLRTEGIPAALLEPVEREIALRADHGADYAYTGYVLPPRPAPSGARHRDSPDRG